MKLVYEFGFQLVYRRLGSRDVDANGVERAFARGVEAKRVEGALMSGDLVRMTQG